MIVFIKKMMEYAAKIEADEKHLPTICQDKIEGHPMITRIGESYQYTINERNKEYEKTIFDNVDELLHKIFEGITFSIATEYEVENRILNQDSRRLIFQKQNELLRMLNTDWERINRSKQSIILEENPFDDFSHKRVNVYEEYVQMGYSESEAWSKSCEDFPLPIRSA